MNNREARETIENLCTVDEVSIVETDIEALRMAIKALEREESVFKALEDVRAEIEDIDGITEIGAQILDEVLGIINRKIKECKHET